MAEVEPIAIVGLGGVFPGALDLSSFAQNIFAGVDVTRPVPSGRWILDPRDVLDPQPGPDKVFSDRACFVEEFSLHPAGLEIDPKLLRDFDLLYSLVLHAGRQAGQDGVVYRSCEGSYRTCQVTPQEGSRHQLEEQGRLHAARRRQARLRSRNGGVPPLKESQTRFRVTGLVPQ